MAKLVICQGCRKKFDRAEEPFQKASKGYYHQACYDKAKGMSKATSQGRKALLDMLKELWGDKTNYPLVAKQIKQYTEEFNYTESGLLGTLHYVLNVKKQRLDPSKGIAILPYFYNQARNHYQNLDNVSFEGPMEINEVEILLSELPYSTKREEMLIDIEKILQGELVDDD